MNTELYELLEKRADPRAAAELARVLAVAAEDISAGLGDERPY